MRSRAIRYTDAGVDRKRARAVKQRIARLARRTFTPGVLAEIGRFAALYQPDRRRWRRPVIVTSVDGVGTKLKLAVRVGRHEGVGVDIVHHCVNDIAALGATPLFFLDYIASSRLQPAVLEQVFRGMSRACRALHVALIGGETAELPGLYAPGDYDLVGFVVGLVERSKLLDGRRVRPGDRLIGLASTGLHTNGYSLARKLLFDIAGLTMNSFVPELKNKLSKELLKSHACYYPLLKPLLERNWVSAAAHITGGGLTENLPRALPPRTAAEVHLDAWPVPPLFCLLERLGRLPPEEMLQTFNMGIGMVLVVPARYAVKVVRFLRRRRAACFEIGRVVRGRAAVRYRGSWR